VLKLFFAGLAMDTRRRQEKNRHRQKNADAAAGKKERPHHVIRGKATTMEQASRIECGRLKSVGKRKRVGTQELLTKVYGMKSSLVLAKEQ